jgi:hypothetical protein
MTKGRIAAAPVLLFLDFITLFAVALARKSFLSPAFFTGLQIKRVTFDFFDDIFLLHFALKTPQCALKSLTVLYVDFCQIKSPPFWLKQFYANSRLNHDTVPSW